MPDAVRAAEQAWIDRHPDQESGGSPFLLNGPWERWCDLLTPAPAGLELGRRPP